MIHKPSDIEIIHLFRVRCPQCGDLPDSPYPSMLDARAARRAHFNVVHHKERI